MVAAPSHPLAERLRVGLALLLALLAAATLWALQREVRGHVEALTGWTRHPVVIESLADEQLVEVEIATAALETMPGLQQPPHPSPHREGHSRVLLPRPSYLWAGLRDEVDLAHHPQDPRRRVLLDVGSLWFPVLAKLVLLALLALAWKGWQRLPWGRDEVWQAGGWTDTATTALRPGARAAAGDELREPEALRRATRIWAWVMAAGTAALAVGAWSAWDDEPVGVAATLLVVLALDLLFVHTFATVRTRRVRWDGEGFADTSLFRTRRVPWSAVASFERLNTAFEEQQQFERLSSSARKGRMRPRTTFHWLARDGAGHELLRLADGVQEQPAFAAFALRCGGKAKGAGAAAWLTRGVAATLEDPAGSPDEDAAATAFPADDARVQALQGSHASAMRWGVAVVLLPFVAAAVYATAQAVWFVSAAARAEGTVVAKSEDGLPSLTVAYMPRGAAEPLQIESDGTESYGAVPLGAKITVFYDAERPAHARLDLFLELWLWPMIFGVLALLVALPFLLALRSLSRRRR